MQKAPGKSHRTISPPVKMTHTPKAPRNKLPPIQNKKPKTIFPTVTNCSLLQIDGVSVPVTTTCTRTHKHSKDVTCIYNLIPALRPNTYQVLTLTSLRALHFKLRCSSVTKIPFWQDKLVWGQITLGGKLVREKIVLGTFCIEGHFVSWGFCPRWLFDWWLIAR